MRNLTFSQFRHLMVSRKAINLAEEELENRGTVLSQGGALVA